MKDGILPLNNETLTHLKGKHPASNNSNNDILPTCVSQRVCPIMFNDFKSINRKVIIHNISILCPDISTFVTKCYATPALVLVIGDTEIMSIEGTT